MALPPMAASEPQLHPLLPRRLAALVYDTFLVLPLIMAAVALSMGLRTILGTGGNETIDEMALNPQLVQLITLIAVTTFFSWFWLRSGQTLGMQAWRIKLVSIDGSRVTPGQAVKRCLAAILSALCLGLGYAWCLFDPNRRYWHDYLSGTELILVSNPKKTDETQADQNSEQKKS